MAGASPTTTKGETSLDSWKALKILPAFSVRRSAERAVTLVQILDRWRVCPNSPSRLSEPHTHGAAKRRPPGDRPVRSPLTPAQRGVPLSSQVFGKYLVGIYRDDHFSSFASKRLGWTCDRCRVLPRPGNRARLTVGGVPLGGCSSSLWFRIRRCCVDNSRIPYSSPKLLLAGRSHEASDERR